MIFFKKRNSIYSFSQRKDLFYLINKLVNDSSLFSEKFSKHLDNLSSYSKREFKEDLNLLQKLIRLDNALVHVFSELQKNKFMYTSQKEQEDFNQCIDLLKKLSKAYKSEKKELKRLFVKLQEPGTNYENNLYLNKIINHGKEIKALEKMSIRELKISREDIKRKKFVVDSVKSKSLGVEIIKEDDDYLIKIYNNDIEVGYITGKLTINSFYVHRSQTHVQYNKFVERAIYLVLKKHLVKFWFSDSKRSPAAQKLYRNLKEYKNLKVEFLDKENRFRLSLK
jgi:hypothetical protein